MLIVILVYLIFIALRNKNFEIKNIIKTITANKILKSYFHSFLSYKKKTLQSAAIKIE